MLMRTRGTINSSSESTYQTISKIEAKIVLATMLEGKNIIIQIQANSNHTTFLKNQRAIKYFPKSKKIGGKMMSNFGISKIPTHCLKEALVT